MNGSTPSCPWCRTSRTVRTSGSTMRSLYCSNCGREFEAEDDGVIGYGAPETYAQRAESRQMRKTQREMK